MRLRRRMGRSVSGKAQQIWLDMERRGVADSWGLLLDFGGLGPRLRLIDAAEYRRGAPKARVAFHRAAGLRRAGSSTDFSRWRSRRPRRRRYRWARPSIISTS